MPYRIYAWWMESKSSRRDGVIHYFGYGSNMNMTSLAAKGVHPRSSRPARLPGWRLLFNVHHWFEHEGGVGNICPSDEPTAEVRGVMHVCDDSDLAKLDAVESYGVGYDRVEVELELDALDSPNALDSPSQTASTTTALAYVGIESYLDDSCRPTLRYLNIIIDGAIAAGIDAAYVERLRRTTVHVPKDYPPFRHADGPVPEFDAESLAVHPRYTAVAGAVFDMAQARWQHHCLWELFGGKDTTLFHVRRHDDSDATETLEDIKHERLTAGQRAYLNAYLHEYAAEYRYVGRYRF
jgi:hypothetical protein